MKINRKINRNIYKVYNVFILMEAKFNLFIGIVCGLIVFWVAWLTITFGDWHGIIVIILNAVASIANIISFINENKKSNKSTAKEYQIF